MAGGCFWYEGTGMRRIIAGVTGSDMHGFGERQTVVHGEQHWHCVLWLLDPSSFAPVLAPIWTLGGCWLEATNASPI